MRSLTRLELSGFKSFANKTVLEFPDGITAIVGPNGSGKSNIVDAIRWLLGEREAKNLRGTRSEDLIFTGTPKRPRMGQAQASLCFENKTVNKTNLRDSQAGGGSKHPGHEFNETNVAREVSRDGVNRYYINKSEVRLKDIQDFFAQARLGTKGMAVITQGESDVFIRVTRAERRAMIEEILGLREYQTKRHDAERRLKNAQINFDKANALIEEILPHLRSLKRQTSRWEKRGELAAELTELENKFFGNKWKEIDSMLKKTDVAVEEKELEFKNLEKQFEAAEKKISELEKNRPHARKELANIKTSIDKLITRRGVMQIELGRISAKIEMPHAAVSGQENISRDRVLKFVKNLHVKLSEYPDKDMLELNALVEEILEDVENMLGELASENNGTQRAPVANKLEVELSKIKGEAENLEKELQKLRKQEKEFAADEDGFYEKFRDTMSESRKLKDKMNVWQNANRELLLQRERCLMRREELVHQIKQAEREVREFEGSPPELDAAEDLNSIEKRILRLRGELMNMGEADEAVVKEAKQTEERHEFLSKELADLKKAEADLRGLIWELKRKIKDEFDKAFVKINSELQKFFELMFGGGSARFKLVTNDKRQWTAGPEDEESATKRKIITGEEGAFDDEIEEGIEIQLTLPRKRVNSLDMLSGGERSLVGIAVLFALISVSPPPFLVLDEIDAALDDRNTRRFAEMLKEFSKRTQFIVVTHNRATMETADVLYGITLNDDGTSKILSLKLESGT